MADHYRHESVFGEAIAIFLAVVVVIGLFIWTNQFAGRYRDHVQGQVTGKSASAAVRLSSMS